MVRLPVAQVFDNDQYNGTNPADPVTSKGRPRSASVEHGKGHRSDSNGLRGPQPCSADLSVQREGARTASRIASILRPMAASQRPLNEDRHDDKLRPDHLARRGFQFFSPTYSHPARFGHWERFHNTSVAGVRHHRRNHDQHIQK